MDSEISVG